MLLEKLFLHNYRNYERLVFEPHPGVNALVGENAAGKTNLLEIIHYLAAGRSHRTHRDAELIRWSEEGFYAKVRVRRRCVSHTLELAYHADRGKSFRLDGVSQTRLSDVLGVINAVLFSPDDLSLMKGGPGGRRSFMDAEISQVSRPYRRGITRYNRILTQRNDVLRELKRTRSSAASADPLLQPWDTQLVETGAAVTAARIRAFGGWAPMAAGSHRQIAGEGLGIHYESSFSPPVDLSAANSSPSTIQELRDEMMTTLVNKRSQEIDRGYTLIGPHRDDLLFLVSGRDVRHYASQGQQRSVVLAVRMAEVGWMKEQTGTAPILLLDDVMSELDTKRAGRLADAVSMQGQTFITCTDLSQLSWEGAPGQIWRVDSGEVTPVDK